MIKVLVVDDDKLVRTGLISAMPWDGFNMQVVGEAKNGEKALEFLASNDVDLLLTDLEMPVMSGIELIRIVRKRYPNTHVVVLTLHQDFEYIQEVLRLGAIDYIAKVQFEKERFEEVLGRIHNIILESQLKEKPIDTQGKTSKVFTSNTGYALLSVQEQPDTRWVDQAIISSLIEIDNSIWFWVPEVETYQDRIYKNLSKAIYERNGWSVIRLEGIEGENRMEVYRQLRRYRQRDFFYDFDDENKISSKSLKGIYLKPNVVTEQEIVSHKERWLSFDWIHQESLFLNLRNELKEMRLTLSRLTHLLYGITVECNRIYASVTPIQIEVPEKFDNWREADLWLTNARETVSGAENKPRYSQEIVNSIMTAVKIVQEELDQSLFAVDVAKRVNLSRSYFNQCFKNIVGHSFNEYLRIVRIEKAKGYLLQTNKSIQWIAERSGYQDDRYFSRVFREQTSMYPSVFRQNKHQ